MKNDDMEQMLLNNASLEDLIKMKIEKEFLADLEKSKEKPKKKVYTDIKDLPREKIFAKELWKDFRIMVQNIVLNIMI